MPIILLYFANIAYFLRHFYFPVESFIAVLPSVIMRRKLYAHDRPLFNALTSAYGLSITNKLKSGHSI